MGFRMLEQEKGNELNTTTTEMQPNKGCSSVVYSFESIIGIKIIIRKNLYRKNKSQQEDTKIRHHGRGASKVSHHCSGARGGNCRRTAGFCKAHQAYRKDHNNFFMKNEGCSNCKIEREQHKKAERRAAQAVQGGR